MTVPALVESGRPLPPSSGLLALIAALSNGLEPGGTIKPASAGELVVLEGRLAVLRLALVPGPQERTRVACAFLLSNWQPTRCIPRDLAEAIVDRYALALAEHPAWAATAACLRLVRGQVTGIHPDYVPSAARVCLTATEELLPYRAERDRLQRILEATQCEARRF